MQLRKIGVVLLALLLAMMAMVPFVSAADDYLDNEKIDQIKGNLISVETAKTHAEFAFVEFTSVWVY